MPGRISRRDWLTLTAGAFTALWLPACHLRSSGTEGLPEDWENDFLGIRLFGMAKHPERADASLLSCADFRAREVRRLTLPIRNAHQIAYRGCNPEKLWVIGNESDSLCRVDLKKLEVEERIEIARDGYVSSGHAEFVTSGNDEWLAMTEYKAGEPSKGCIALRNPQDLSLVRRVPSLGDYPHVIAFHPRDGELVVQNLGQQAGLGEQYSPRAELVVFDVKTWKPKRRVRPGREGRSLQPLPGRAEANPTNEAFLRYAGYQLDSKATLYPERGQLVVEYPLGPSISLWAPADSRMNQEIPLPGLFPTHTYLGPGARTLLVASREKGLIVVPKKYEGRVFADTWLASFRTDMHVGPLAIECGKS